MKPIYRYIFQVIDWYKDSARIIVYNQCRKPDTKREYKYSKKRKAKLRNMMYKLWQDGYAHPDFTYGMTWGVYPEYHIEDPTLTQEQEWPFK